MCQRGLIHSTEITRVHHGADSRPQGRRVAGVRVATAGPVPASSASSLLGDVHRILVEGAVGKKRDPLAQSGHIAQARTAVHIGQSQYSPTRKHGIKTLRSSRFG